MGLITEESKCKFEGSIEILSKREYNNIEKAYAFAETELQNLAIEFAEWYYNLAHTDNESTIKQQFEYYIEQRKTN